MPVPASTQPPAAPALRVVLVGDPGQGPARKAVDDAWWGDVDVGGVTHLPDRSVAPLIAIGRAAARRWWPRDEVLVLRDTPAARERLAAAAVPFEVAEANPWPDEGPAALDPALQALDAALVEREPDAVLVAVRALHARVPAVLLDRAIELACSFPATRSQGRALAHHRIDAASRAGRLLEATDLVDELVASAADPGERVRAGLLQGIVWVRSGSVARGAAQLEALLPECTSEVERRAAMLQLVRARGLLGAPPAALEALVAGVPPGDERAWLRGYAGLASLDELRELPARTLGQACSRASLLGLALWGQPAECLAVAASGVRFAAALGDAGAHRLLEIQGAEALARLGRRAEARASLARSTDRQGVLGLVSLDVEEGRWDEARARLRTLRAAPDRLGHIARSLGLLPAVQLGDPSGVDAALDACDAGARRFATEPWPARFALRAAELLAGSPDPAARARAVRALGAAAAHFGRDAVRAQLAAIDGPTPLERVDLLRPLARGAHAEVWVGAVRPWSLVSPDAPVHEVAVKILREAGPNALDELRVLTALRHPNIVPPLDAGVVSWLASEHQRGALREGAPYVVMGLASGGTLEPHLGRWAWPQVLTATLALLDALAHAHAHGVVHRDLKPANLLLARPDDPTSVQIADFGLAPLPPVGVVAGTPVTMAPEQFRGARVGPWTDLYALGCVVWMLVTGSPPYDGSLAAVRAGHLAGAPRFDPLVAVPQGLEDWLRELLAKAPADRPARASLAARALRALGPADRAATAAGGPPPLASGTFGWSVCDGLPSLGEPVVEERLPPTVPLPPRPPLPPPRLDGLPWIAGASLRRFAAVRHLGRTAERERLWGLLGGALRGDRACGVWLSGARWSGRRSLASWLAAAADEVGALTGTTWHGPGEAPPPPGGPALRIWTGSPPGDLPGDRVAPELWLVCAEGPAPPGWLELALGPRPPREIGALLVVALGGRAGAAHLRRCRGRPGVPGALGEEVAGELPDTLSPRARALFGVVAIADVDLPQADWVGPCGFLGGPERVAAAWVELRAAGLLDGTRPADPVLGAAVARAVALDPRLHAAAAVALELAPDVPAVERAQAWLGAGDPARALAALRGCTAAAASPTWERLAEVMPLPPDARADAATAAAAASSSAAGARVRSERELVENPDEAVRVALLEGRVRWQEGRGEVLRAGDELLPRVSGVLEERLRLVIARCADPDRRRAELDALARGARDPALRAEALRLRAQGRSGAPEDVARARDDLREALALDPRLWPRAVLDAPELADVPEALDALHAALDRLAADGDLGVTAGWLALSVACARRGRFERAVEAAQVAGELASMDGSRRGSGLAAVAEAAIRRLAGDPAPWARVVAGSSPDRAAQVAWFERHLPPGSTSG
jgi:hypothetical protein